MSCNQTYKPHVAAISFGLHNAMPYIRKNIQVIEYVANWFVDHTFFYLENDSTDGTIPFIRSWAMSRKVRGLHMSFNTSSHKLCLHTYNCEARFQFLAKIRNILWKSIQSWTAWTVWIPIDVDFLHFDKAVFQQSIEIANALDVAAMFSTSKFRRRNGMMHLYEAYHFIKDKNNKRKDGCPVLVKSAFGGVAIYFSKIRNIPNLSYNTSTSTYEHIDFNLQIHRFGYRMYINRRMNPIYKWGYIS